MKQKRSKNSINDSDLKKRKQVESEKEREDRNESMTRKIKRILKNKIYPRKNECFGVKNGNI